MSVRVVASACVFVAVGVGAVAAYRRYQASRLLESLRASLASLPMTEGIYGTVPRILRIAYDFGVSDTVVTLEIDPVTSVASRAYCARCRQTDCEHTRAVQALYGAARVTC